MFHIVYFHPIHRFFFPTYESVVFRSLNRKIFRIIFLYLYRIYLEIFQQCGRKFSALGKISENSGSESENSRPPPTQPAQRVLCSISRHIGLQLVIVLRQVKIILPTFLQFFA